MNLVNKNEDINLETNNAENNAIEYIECETNSETSETEIKMDDSNGIFIYILLIPFNLCYCVVLSL